MNYIILNGKKSTAIKGLLIQSLPPISKPLIRTQVEEIDGRDGDIVTRLGYSAYDKEISIGLFGDYDIDSVIGYFNSEGVVTFSNEPDKYYYYQIIDQIDFERLVRFRTAKAKLHMQPFKYSNVETSKSFDDVGELQAVTLRNNGNYIAKPIIQIEGAGLITLSLNGMQMFAIDMQGAASITIDTQGMNAYSDGLLMNRNVLGDYDNFALNVGVNTVEWSGDVKSISFQKYSRWI